MMQIENVAENYHLNENVEDENIMFYNMQKKEKLQEQGGALDA